MSVWRAPMLMDSPLLHVFALGSAEARQLAAWFAELCLVLHMHYPACPTATNTVMPTPCKHQADEATRQLLEPVAHKRLQLAGVDLATASPSQVRSALLPSSRHLASIAAC